MPIRYTQLTGKILNRSFEQGSPNDPTLRVEAETLEDVRNRLADIVLSYLAVLGIPALALSIARTGQIGWKPVFYLHIAALMTLWLFVLLRRRLTLHPKAAFMVLVLYSLGLGSLLQFGLVGASVLHLSLMCIAATLFFGIPAGLAGLVLAIMTTLVVMVAVRQGEISYGFNISSYVTAPLEWVITAVNLAIFTGATIVTLGAIIRALNRSRDSLAERKAELERTNEALLHSEQRLSAIVSTTPNVAIEGYDIDGNILFWNNAAETMFGYSAEEAIGKNVGELILTPEDTADFIATLRNVVTTGQPVGPVDCRSIRSDGQEMWSLSTVFEVPSEEASHYLICMDIDVTERRHMEEEKRQFYRNTISSVTDGKLQIMSYEDTRPYVEDAQLKTSIHTAIDIPVARQYMTNFFSSKGLSGDNLVWFVTGLTEAMTNAAKHAGGGTAFAGSRDDRLWAGVQDSGSGIATLTIPSATLRRGFSTKHSMGLGYSIIINVSDCVYLATGEQGTTVVLFKDLIEEQPALSLDDLPDTWSNIGSI